MYFNAFSLGSSIYSLNFGCGIELVGLRVYNKECSGSKPLVFLCHCSSQTVAVAWLNQLSSAVAWVTRPERPKGVKDVIKQAQSGPEGPQPRSRGPEGT